VARSILPTARKLLSFFDAHRQEKRHVDIGRYPETFRLPAAAVRPIYVPAVRMLPPRDVRVTFAQNLLHLARRVSGMPIDGERSGQHVRGKHKDQPPRVFLLAAAVLALWLLLASMGYY
jgi:hypothetical protein